MQIKQKLKEINGIMLWIKWSGTLITITDVTIPDKQRVIFDQNIAQVEYRIPNNIPIHDIQDVDINSSGSIFLIIKTSRTKVEKRLTHKTSYHDTIIVYPELVKI